MLGLEFLFLVVMILLGVAFYTLMERSVLGYSQDRSGPNSAGWMGLIQPFSDGMKLFLSEFIVPVNSNVGMYLLSPCIGFFLSVIMLMLLGWEEGFMGFKYSFVVMLCISSIASLLIISTGWSSNSCYSLLGGLRVVAQMISYEVIVALMLMSLIYSVGSMRFEDFSMFHSWGLILMGFFVMFLIWIISILAECNRTPFDLAEGESELVSGFNVEYGGGLFAFIFLAEYTSMIFMSVLSVYIFFGITFYSLKVLLIMYLYLWMRASLPRIRYDMLMNLAWKFLLMIILMMMMFYLGFVTLYYV
nr:NADH dehydrogenase subunit 1 [Zorotypus medoensis]